jgi:DNA-binding MarR family transcriptional regulator
MGSDEHEARSLGSVLGFMRALWAVDHGLEAASKRMESRFGVTGPQRLVIRILGRYPNASAGRLAEILHLHPSTLTGILKRLEGRGLIARKPDPTDGRRALFALTARGSKLDGLRSGTVESALRRVLQKVPERKVASAHEVLLEVASALSDV